MNDAAAVRNRILDALRLDLVGPRPGEPRDDAYVAEILPVAPSKWYLTGFLVPYEAPADQRSDDDSDDALDQVDRAVDGDDDNAPEATSARKAFFPSSMGLSVLVPRDTTKLQVRISWADYAPMVEGEGDTAGGASGGEASESEETEGESDPGARVLGWRRLLREAEVPVALEEGDPESTDIPDGEGLKVVVSVRPVGDTDLVPADFRSVSVFLVNQRQPSPDMTRDAAYVFQAELSLHAEPHFVARPNLRGRHSDDWDERVADLQYADAMEYAVGHNISAVAVIDPDRRCRQVQTAWMPTADVEKVVPDNRAGVELGMEALAGAVSAEAIRDMVGPMITGYAAWIDGELRRVPNDGARAQVSRDLMARAGRARDRIQAGLEALDQPHVLGAFRIANRAIAAAIRQRNCHGAPGATPAAEAPPAWRPFQLAFLLTNIAGVVDGEHPDRKVVDLLFFPTGGGKTEAYLGLAAFTMVLRRLRDPSIHSAGLSVIMRYTLRLLTLDQLGRAATLICALELERQNDVPTLGSWPFEIGLWVGQTATPNAMGKKGDPNRYSARERTISFLNDDKRKALADPAGELPLVRDQVPERQLHAAARLQRTDRLADHVRQPALCVSRAAPGARVAHPGRGRSDLPAAPGLHDRDGGQVRQPAVDRRDRRALRPRGAIRRRRVLWTDPGRHGAGPGAPAATAGPHHPGRAAPDLRALGDHGRFLRDSRRRAVRQPRGPRGTAAEDRRLHGDGAPRRAADPWRLRARQCGHLSAAGTRQTGLVLCEDREPGGATPTHVRRGRGAGKEPQGRAAADVSGAAVGRAEGVAGGPGGAQPGQPGRSLHDAGRLLQLPARTRGQPPDRRG